MIKFKVHKGKGDGSPSTRFEPPLRELTEKATKMIVARMWERSQRINIGTRMQYVGTLELGVGRKRR